MKAKAMATAACISFLGAAALATPALGQDAAWYAGIGAARSKARSACDSNTALAGLSCDDTDSAWRIYGGGRFTRYFGVEVGYSDLGRVKASGGGVNAEWHAKVSDYVGLVALPIGRAFSVYGKLGFYHSHVDLSSNTGASAKAKNNDATFGAGVEILLGHHLGLRGEWRRYKSLGDDAVGGTSDVDVVGASALWRF